MDIFSLEEAAWKMRNGSVVAYPTETVYGLGTIIYEQEAVARIKRIKGLPSNKPLSVLISKTRPGMLEELVSVLCPAAQRLAKFYWPGPLTIIHAARPEVPDYITGGTGEIGLRCSSHHGINKLVEAVGHPIITTSANLTGGAPATAYEEVFSIFEGLIDGILLFDSEDQNEHTTASNLPSTIVRVDQVNIEILREGAIKKDDILRKIYD